MNPRGRFVRSARGDGITWVGPQAAEGADGHARPAPPPGKGGLAKALTGLAAILMLQGVILLGFRAKEQERASQQTVAATMNEAGEPPLQEAPPAWSSPLLGPVFPGLEAIRRAGQEAYVLRKPGARLSDCRLGRCE